MSPIFPLHHNTMFSILFFWCPASAQGAWYFTCALCYVARSWLTWFMAGYGFVTDLAHRIAGHVARCFCLWSLLCQPREQIFRCWKDLQGSGMCACVHTSANMHLSGTFLTASCAVYILSYARCMYMHHIASTRSLCWYKLNRGAVLTLKFFSAGCGLRRAQEDGSGGVRAMAGTYPRIWEVIHSGIVNLWVIHSGSLVKAATSEFWSLQRMWGVSRLRIRVVNSVIWPVTLYRLFVSQKWMCPEVSGRRGVHYTIQ